MVTPGWFPASALCTPILPVPLPFRERSWTSHRSVPSFLYHLCCSGEGRGAQYCFSNHRSHLLISSWSEVTSWGLVTEVAPALGAAPGTEQAVCHSGQFLLND